MIELQERKDLTPLCPYCEKPLHKVFFRSIRALLGRRYIYSCASCRKALNISHRKGFWMG